MKHHTLAVLLALTLIAVTAIGWQPAVKPPAAIKVDTPDTAKLALCDVVTISDGNTVQVRPSGKPDAEPSTVRLIGVDPGANFTKEAGAYLTNLLKGEQVWLEEGDFKKTDAGGRTLAYLYRSPDGLFINLEMVRNGYAATTTDEPFKHRQAFTLFQLRADAAHKGRFAASAKAAVDPKPQEQAVTVYGTKSGAKYHNAGCSYLSKSSNSMTLEQAKAKGLTPCSKCNPPR